MNVGHVLPSLVLLLAHVFLFVSATTRRGMPLKDMWPWYHSGEEIHGSLEELASQCQGAEAVLSQQSEINAAEAAGQAITLDVLRIRRTGAQAKKKAMLVFGEHARELISPESALNFAQALCGHGPHAEWASKVLDNVSFTLVPNANPMGRKQVEEGNYCKRTNEDGVDLNRNFGDDHHADEKRGDETNSGPSGFSEPESRMLKALIDDERPDIYLSVHSGAYLLGTPMGYTRDSEPASETSMMDVLGPISEKYCDGNCPFGNLAELIHYDSPGCDIDYVSEKIGTPYVFTWEIYVGERFRGPYLEEARLRRKHQSDANRDPLGFLQRQRRTRRASKLRGQTASRRTAVAAAWKKLQGPENEELLDNCIDQFNPQTQDETEAVISKWTSAYLELCQQVSQKSAAPTALSWDAKAATPASSSWDALLGSMGKS